jgi:anthranilate synthase component 2
MILVIDNYDSFTYNLVHLIGVQREDVRVYRNDTISVEGVLDIRPDAIILSPGPCTPDEAGICVPLVKAVVGTGIPLLGVCLGHQSILQAAGARIVRARHPMHGKTSTFPHDGRGLFAGVPSPLTVTRYHSLVAAPDTVPDTIEIAAHSADGEIMAARWIGEPIHGVQFHPESIASEAGAEMIGNFLALAPRREHAA